MQKGASQMVTWSCFKKPRFPIVHSEGSLVKSIEAVKSLDVRECKASVPWIWGFLRDSLQIP